MQQAEVRAVDWQPSTLRFPQVVLVRGKKG
jgi:hypothetical protein